MSMNCVRRVIFLLCVEIIRKGKTVAGTQICSATEKESICVAFLLSTALTFKQILVEAYYYTYFDSYLQYTNYRMNHQYLSPSLEANNALKYRMTIRKDLNLHASSCKIDPNRLKY